MKTPSLALLAGVGVALGVVLGLGVIDVVENGVHAPRKLAVSLQDITYSSTNTRPTQVPAQTLEPPPVIGPQVNATRCWFTEEGENAVVVAGGSVMVLSTPSNNGQHYCNLFGISRAGTGVHVLTWAGGTRRLCNWDNECAVIVSERKDTGE